MSLMPVVEAWGVASTIVDMVKAFTQRREGGFFYNPYGAQWQASAVERATTDNTGRMIVSGDGTLPDDYGYGQDARRVGGEYNNTNPGFTNAVTGERGETLETTPGNPTAFDGFQHWLESVGARVGTFVMGAVIIVLALYLLARTSQTPATPVVVVQPKGNGGKASSSPQPQSTGKAST